METITIQGIISATSNKQSGKFDSKNPKKSAFVIVDKKNKAILENFGLTEYTPEDKDAKPYFQIKMSENVKRFEKGTKEPLEVFNGNITEKDGTDTPNYSSNEREIGLAIMKGENKGNEFVRIYAINCLEGIFTQNETQNPFEV